MLNDIQKRLRTYAKPEKISIYRNFFKTGKGEYGEGDVFIGVTVPDTRKVAQEFVDASFKELLVPLNSEVHEDRMCALLILVYKMKKTTNDEEKKKIVDFYIKHHLRGNNWDLIDCVSDKILGTWLLDKDKSLLYRYAKSNNLWERRISIITTFQFIRNDKFDDTIKISETLLGDTHDLIHKATGWMLREVGKRDISVLETFLKKHYKRMPRTMLRYAIEKFDKKKQQKYLKGTI